MSERTGQEATTEQDRSVAQLVQDMAEQVRRLVRDELRLAVEELRRKGKCAGIGAALTGTKQLKKATPPVSEEAVTGVRQDVDVVRQRGASDHVRA